jgi:hypothetical protein
MAKIVTFFGEYQIPVWQAHLIIMGQALLTTATMLLWVWVFNLLKKGAR